MKQITEKDFASEVTNFKGTVLADFYADWCGPCRMLSPMLEEMSNNNKKSEVKFVKVNVDENQQLAGQFGIMSIPTVVVFKDGKVVNQLIGVRHPSEYERAISV